MRHRLRPPRVYLIHIDEPIGGHAGHYIGFTRIGVRNRLRNHAKGKGGRLMAVAMERNAPWRLARVWSGGMALERRLKDVGNSPRFCPICSGPKALDRYRDGSLRCQRITSSNILEGSCRPIGSLIAG